MPCRKSSLKALFDCQCSRSWALFINRKKRISYNQITRFQSITVQYSWYLFPLKPWNLVGGSEQSSLIFYLAPYVYPVQFLSLLSDIDCNEPALKCSNIVCMNIIQKSWNTPVVPVRQYWYPTTTPKEIPCWPGSSPLLVHRYYGMLRHPRKLVSFYNFYRLNAITSFLSFICICFATHFLNALLMRTTHFIVPILRNRDVCRTCRIYL